jgi:hypothetical protein
VTLSLVVGEKEIPMGQRRSIEGSRILVQDRIAARRVRALSKDEIAARKETPGKDLVQPQN